VAPALALASMVSRRARTSALRGVVATATACRPSAALRVLHELFNVALLDPICAHHLSGHGAAQKVNQLRLPRSRFSTRSTCHWVTISSGMP
jgi:hypothetical protein